MCHGLSPSLTGGIQIFSLTANLSLGRLDYLRILWAELRIGHKIHIAAQSCCGGFPSAAPQRSLCPKAKALVSCSVFLQQKTIDETIWERKVYSGSFYLGRGKALLSHMAGTQRKAGLAKCQRAAGFWTQQRVNTRRSPSSLWPQYDCAWRRESHRLATPLSRCPARESPWSLHLLRQKLVWQLSTECPQEESQLYKCTRFPNSYVCPCTVHVLGYTWATSQKPQNIVHELYDPRRACCSTAGKTKRIYGGLLFSDLIL